MSETVFSALPPGWRWVPFGHEQRLALTNTPPGQDFCCECGTFQPTAHQNICEPCKIQANRARNMAHRPAMYGSKTKMAPRRQTTGHPCPRCQSMQVFPLRLAVGIVQYCRECQHEFPLEESVHVAS
jgi:hypothetical protein